MSVEWEFADLLMVLAVESNLVAAAASWHKLREHDDFKILVRCCTKCWLPHSPVMSALSDLDVFLNFPETSNLWKGRQHQYVAQLWMDAMGKYQ